MRRWLIVLLLAVLPWQWAWSAAAPYCRHEAVPGASHPGHHAHRHDHVASISSAADQDSAGDLSGSVQDLDCTACHGAAMQASHLAAMTVHEVVVRAFASTPLPLSSSDPPCEVERPKWRCTA